MGDLNGNLSIRKTRSNIVDKKTNTVKFSQTHIQIIRPEVKPEDLSNEAYFDPELSKATKIVPSNKKKETLKN